MDFQSARGIYPLLPTPTTSPSHFLPHNFYNESQRSTGNYLASETELPSVWFMQRCATVFFATWTRLSDLYERERKNLCLPFLPLLALSIQHFAAASCPICSIFLLLLLLFLSAGDSGQRSMAIQGRSCIHDLALPFALWLSP